jgi:hypothetical protein
MMFNRLLRRVHGRESGEGAAQQTPGNAAARRPAASAAAPLLPARRDGAADDRYSLTPRKSQPYLPDKTGRHVQCWNGALSLPGEVPDSAGDRAIKCRHLAYAYAWDERLKRTFLHDLSTPELMSYRFRGRLAPLAAEADAAFAQAPQAARHLMPARAFGAYLEAWGAALMDSSLSPGTDRLGADCLLRIQGHLMALHVQRKCKPGRPEYIAASVYDPNSTGNHRRVEVDARELHRFRQWELADFVERARNEYLDDAGELTVAALSLAPHLYPSVGQLSLCDAESNAVGSANRISAQMHLALSSGFADAVHGLCARLSLETQSDGLKRQVLAGQEGLYLALQRGLACAIDALADGLSTIELAPALRRELLAARRSADGAPGLAMAMQHGHVTAIEAYGRLLRQLGVRGAQAHPFLEAAVPVGPHSYSALSFALQSGHADAVTAWGRVALALEADPDWIEQRVLVPAPHEPDQLRRLAPDAATREAFDELRADIRQRVRARDAGSI